MMICAILAYSVATATSAIAWDWTSFAILRFVVGITVGSEWATGSSMMAEFWPARARGKGAGLMQCGLGLGFLLASCTWLVVQHLGPNAWRYMFLLGALPGLLTFWIRRSLDESDAWLEAASRRAAARARKAAGGVLAPEDAILTRLTLIDLFANPALRGRTLSLLAMSLATTVGFWSISSWVPQYVGAAAGSGSAQHWAALAGIAYTTGSITGYVAFGFLADAFGRRAVTAFFFAMAIILTPLLFFSTAGLYGLLALAFANAIFSNGQYTWMAVWLPELYPTRLRSTAISFVFNAPRFIAFLGPLMAGTLISKLGGLSATACLFALIYLFGLAALPFVPETRGEPLPC